MTRGPLSLSADDLKLGAHKLKKSTKRLDVAPAQPAAAGSSGLAASSSSVENMLALSRALATRREAAREDDMGDDTFQ